MPPRRGRAGAPVPAITGPAGPCAARRTARVRGIIAAMPHRPDALKFLAPNWFAIVIGLAALALAWAQAAPVLGEAAGALALALGALAALALLALLALSWLRWQRHPEAVAADARHPLRHAWAAAIPMALTLPASAAAHLLGSAGWIAALWWLGSALQLAATVWMLSRWFGAAKGGQPGWAGITPLLLAPAAGHVLAPLAGPALGAPMWAAAQFGMGLLLWLLLLGLLLARLLAQGLWPDRLLPANFITVAPPALAGSGVLQLGGPPALAWMCWGVALLFVLWCLPLLKRTAAQPFAINFWALGWPLALFAALSLRLTQHAGMPEALAMMALALATLAVLLLGLATYKGLRNASLLAPEPVAQLNLATDTLH